MSVVEELEVPRFDVVLCSCDVLFRENLGISCARYCARAISARDIARACSVQLIRCAILDYTVVASLIFMCDEAKT